MPSSKYYTDGLEVISIIYKSKTGYLVKDQDSKVILLNNLNSYRLLDDKKNIKDWYKDSVDFVKQHPIAAFGAVLGVFFGLIDF